MARFRLQTPWGHADQHKDIGKGIVRVSTPGHGGYFVPDGLLHHIPAAQRDWAAKWSGSENWYEEDCCWAAVALAFPALFPADALVVAGHMIAQFVPVA